MTPSADLVPRTATGYERARLTPIARMGLPEHPLDELVDFVGPLCAERLLALPH